jgi:hypothetical protein
VVLSLLQTAIECAYNTIYLTGDIDQNALATTPNTRSNGINLSTTAVTNLMLPNIVYGFDFQGTDIKICCKFHIPTAFNWGTGSSNYNDFM